MHYCVPSSRQMLVDHLVQGLNRELDLAPKPGLVDPYDNGSHPDLDYALMQRSITMLEQYFRRFAAEVQAGCDAEGLRRLGAEAEVRMLRTLGTNTHRGALFLGSLLLVGAARAREAAAVPASIAVFAQELFAARLPAGTLGAGVRAQYQAGGIVGEALCGLPGLFHVGLPALEDADRLRLGYRRGLYLAMARLMQGVEDTTALRRCGRTGLARLRVDGRALEVLLLSARDPEHYLDKLNARYRRIGLTMGGVADMLAMSIAWAAFSGKGALAPDAGARSAWNH